MRSEQQFILDEKDKNFFISLPTLLKPEYSEELKQLAQFYNDESLLPSKINISENENLKYDRYRIEFIISATQFLRTYYCGNNTVFKPGVFLNTHECDFAEGINITNIREILIRISRTIFNISGSVRVKYKDLLKPEPFTWETFEHLGGLMKTRPRDWLAITIRNVYGDVAKRLMDEFCAEETTIEAALPTIVNNDIQQLWILFSYIQKVENSEQSLLKTFPLKGFIAIKALTRRIIDLESLIQLLKYADNHITCFDHQDVYDRINRSAENGKLYTIQVDDSDKQFQRKINLSSKLGKHAALRRLEMIGELITGKYFSSFIKELDPGTDWGSLVIIRDTIAHQDEGDNGLKISQLIDDNVLFETILGKEMQELFYKLTQVVASRDMNLPKYDNDPNQFWRSIYDHETQQFEIHQKDSLSPVVVIEPRTTAENINFIVDELHKNNVSPNIQAQFERILDGSQPIPTTKEMGDLYRYLPSKLADKDLHEKCKSIIVEAIRPKMSPMQREEARKRNAEEADQRKQNRENLFTGITGIRKLASEFSKKQIPSISLSPLERIESAIASLENIKEFLEQDKFIQANFDFPDIETWSNAQNSETVNCFFARLITDPELSDALEYNAAQLLQQLDRISQYPEAKGHAFLDKEISYEAMRCLRNWVEHGNHLEDKEQYDPGKARTLLRERQKVVGPVMIRLIFELLPTLYSLKKSYEILQASKISTSHSSLWTTHSTSLNGKNGKHYNNNEKWGPGYGF